MVALPALGEVRDLEIAVEPEVPTWTEPVTVVVRGSSDCAVDLSARQDGQPDIRVDVEQTCPADRPPFHPFAASVLLGRLAVGERTVLAVADGDGGFVSEVFDFTVYRPGDWVITLPDAPTDGAPFEIAVAWINDDGCHALFVNPVEDRVIEMFVGMIIPAVPCTSGVLQQPLEIGPLAAGDYELRVFHTHGPEDQVAKRTIRVYDDDGCVPSDTRLCLNEDRFAVTVDWTDFAGNSGSGRSVPLRSDTGLFWFFAPDNLELTVKVLDGCGVNGHYWVFVSSGSTVEYEVEVTDTAGGTSHTYGNALRQTPRLIADTTAFASCP